MVELGAEMDTNNSEPLAKIWERKGDHYLIATKFNENGKYRIVEKLPTLDMAELFVKQLCEDEVERHRCLRETRDWNFLEDRPKKKGDRKPRTHLPEVVFSFED
jgi:hypothetical protein